MLFPIRDGGSIFTPTTQHSGLSSLQTEMATQQVSIVGAGIAGLVLGRALARRGVPAIIYEKNSQQQFAKRHGYGITLQQTAYCHLLPLLGLSEIDFRAKFAVDAHEGGIGLVNQHDSTDCRLNRHKLEKALVSDLSVKWEHGLQKITPSSDGLQLALSNGESVRSSITVGTDGPHSACRVAIAPDAAFDILGYVVFNGKRRISNEDYTAHLAPHLGSGTTVMQRHIGSVLLEVKLDDIGDEVTSLSYTFSRPAHQNDVLFTPNRSKSDATTIPEELYEEIAGLESSIDAPFRYVFNVETMRKDRLLSWLMRSVSVELDALTAGANKGVVLIGDAAHHGPILGSYGANEAILDAVMLATHLAEPETTTLHSFYTHSYPRWAKEGEDGMARLAQMHQVSPRL